MAEETKVFDIDHICMTIVDERGLIRDDCETAEVELSIGLHDSISGIEYMYHVFVECQYRDDWRIFCLCSENGKTEEYPPFKMIEDRIEKMIRLFLGDFMVYFDRAFEEEECEIN